MSLPNGMGWEPVKDPECAEGWVCILGASNQGFDYYFGRGPAGGLWLELEIPSDGAAFEGQVAPGHTFSIQVSDKNHAERIIRAIEGAEVLE